MLDPLLTGFGEEQCHTLASNFPHHSKVRLLLSSPLRRTLYTTILAFQPALDQNPECKVVAQPLLQETSDVPCDTGSDLAVLRQEVEDKELPVDLSLVTDDWTDKRMGTKYAPNSNAIRARAAEARDWIREKTKNIDGDVVLVSHGGFLHYFTEDFEDSGVHNGTGWSNTEYRTYTWTQEAEAHLIETPESRVRRGKSPVAPSREMQVKFFELAMQGWEDQGLQNPSKMGIEKPADARL
ncbi:MAG: hypothetical protein Q9227_002316 [Pyrenula ochraceoflavens]